MNSLSILNGAGTGKVLAHRIVDGTPPLDVTAINVNRFTKHEATRVFWRGPRLENAGLVCANPGSGQGGEMQLVQAKMV